MSFADDFFGPTFVSALLKGAIMPFAAFRKSPFIPDEKETIVTWNGRELKDEAGDVVTKVLTSSNSEYAVVKSKDDVVEGKTSIILEGLHLFDSQSATMRGALYNRRPLQDGTIRTTSTLVFFEIGWDKLFIPTTYHVGEGDQITAVRGHIIRRKPASDYAM